MYNNCNNDDVNNAEVLYLLCFDIGNGVPLLNALILFI